MKVTPRIALANLPPLCRLGPRFLTMTGLFRVWLAAHFQPDNIEDEHLRDYVWNKDPKQTRIVIESNGVWDPRIVEKRPSVVIKRGGWQGQTFGINDRMMGETPTRPGERHYANYWQGSHTLFVCAGEYGEVELLANEVFRELNQFGPSVENWLGLFRFRVAQIGEVGKLEEARENFVVPIDVGYVLEEGWTVKSEAPFFQTLLSTLN